MTILFKKGDWVTILFKKGDWVRPTYNYSYLQKQDCYEVKGISTVSHLKSRDYGKPRLSIVDDYGVLRNFDPKNFVVSTSPSSMFERRVYLKDRKPEVGDLVAWPSDPYSAYEVLAVNHYYFEIDVNGHNIVHSILDNQYAYYVKTKDPDMANSITLKAKSRYVVANSDTGAIVASSGAEDAHFNPWTDETLKEWLNDTVGSLLRSNPGAKYDVYSFEMQGKLPNITVDWVSK